MDLLNTRKMQNQNQLDNELRLTGRIAEYGFVTSSSSRPDCSSSFSSSPSSSFSSRPDWSEVAQSSQALQC